MIGSRVAQRADLLSLLGSYFLLIAWYRGYCFQKRFAFEAINRSPCLAVKMRKASRGYL